METQTRNIIIGAVAILVVLAAAYLLYTRPAGEDILAAGEGVATSTSPVQGDGGYTIKEVPVPAGVTAPDYKKPVVISPSVSTELAASIRSQYAAAQAAIESNPQSFDGWVMLGVMQKQAGDYRSAEASWKYVSDVYPDNVVTYANLADLYTFFLHDNAKAVAAYQQAIKNDPKQIRLYDDFYQLYSSYPASAAALKASLEAGIKTNPDSDHLKQLLSQLEAVR